MTPLEKLLSAVRTAPSWKLKRFAVQELIKQLPEFSDHVLCLLRNIYDLICSENTDNREFAAQILRAMEFFEYEISFSECNETFTASDFIYLQTKDMIQDVPMLQREKQQRLIRKKLKLEHADTSFIETLGTEATVPLSTFRTAQDVKKEIENIYDFFEAINLLLLSPEWHKRHGAFLAHSAIVESFNAQGGEKKPGKVRIRIKSNLFVRIFEILHNDKFNDFQDNRTSAPVREAAAQLLGLIYPHLQDTPVIPHLVAYLGSTDWQEQFSGLIGLIELKEFIKRGEIGGKLSRSQFNVLLQLLYKLLESNDEDVKYLSAELLTALMKQNELEIEFLHQVASRAWDQLEAEIDIAHSKASLMVLLKEIYLRYPTQFSIPDSFAIFCPCFTSPIQIIRENILEFCAFFNSDELLYMLAESILLPLDDSYIARAKSVLKSKIQAFDSSSSGTDLAEFATHFLRIISSSLYKPYNTDDFACYEDTFFTRDGIRSIGSERVLANRVCLFDVLRLVDGLHTESKSMLGAILSSLLSEPDTAGSEKCVPLSLICINEIEKNFKKFSSLNRMPVKEFKKIFEDNSYSSVFPGCDEHVLEYIRLVLAEHVSMVSDPALYFQRETCEEMLRLLTVQLLQSGSLESCVFSLYTAMVNSKISVYKDAKLASSQLLLKNANIFFEELGTGLISRCEGALNKILSDAKHILFFEETVQNYVDTEPSALLDRIFQSGLEEKNTQLLSKMIHNLKYNEVLVRHLLSSFECDLFAKLIDHSDPSFNILFVKNILKTFTSGGKKASELSTLLGILLPTIHLTPNPRISRDLLLLIESEKTEVSMLLDPSLIPEYEIACKINCDLRDYQKAGIRWLAFLHRFNLNGILADDMGLGKTVQILTFILSEINKQKGSTKIVKKGKKKDKTALKCLIVCPSALLTHWKDEAMKFYNVTAEIYKSKGALPENELIITSYDTLRRDSGVLGAASWFIAVFDEGHILRNPNTVLYQKAQSLNFNRLFILTGTPVHNSVEDLFSLFNLILPSYLEDASQYTCRVTDKNVDAVEERLSRLQKKVLPFILRRLKTDVLTDLPPKIIKDILVEMSKDHKKLYAEVAGKSEEEEELSYSNIKARGLELTRRLLRVVAHPRFIREGIEASKIPALKDIFTMCEGRKMLIFFQQQKTIDFVAEDLGLSEYLRLDGSVPISKRGEIAKQFNTGTCPYLFLTTAVGGLGLNLTSATVVVFYEHDWNPFNDLQAMDRAHRLGQKYPVDVFRLILRDTIEEKVMGYQKFKLFVANALVTQQNTDVERMETKDLLERFM